MSEDENLLLRSRQGIDGYSRTQQKLGEFMLSDLARVVYLTIAELARESDTSEASVAHLCRVLRCKGYNEFKMALALDLQQGQPVEHSGNEIDNVVSKSVQALQDTAELLDRALLEPAALALHQAQSVQIYGVAASAILGEYLHYKLLHLGRPAQLFSSIHHAAMSAATLNKDTLVVAISSSGSTCDLLHVVKLARKQGVRVLALSSTPRSPSVSLSDIQLVAAKPEGPLSVGVLNAKMGMMLLIELLATSLIVLDERYSNISQQTASTTLPLLL